MDAAWTLLGLLIITNAAQFWWWSRQVQTLIDKLMSRNYAEYVASKNTAPSSLRPTLADAQVEQAGEDNLLKELNQHFGM